MEQRGTATDRHGRLWTASIVRESEAAEEDFRFWYDNLTPEQRVAEVEGDGVLRRFRSGKEGGGVSDRQWTEVVGISTAAAQKMLWMR